MKKIIALALALVMAMSVFVGCATGSSATNDIEVTTEPVSTTVPAVTTVTEPMSGTLPAEISMYNVMHVQGVKEINFRDLEVSLDNMAQGEERDEAALHFALEYSLRQYGISHANFWKFVDVDSLKLCAVGDTVVVQYKMNKVEDPSETVWNCKIENADQWENRAYDIEIGQDFMWKDTYDKGFINWTVYTWLLEDDEATDKEELTAYLLYIGYDESEKKLYTIYGEAPYVLVSTDPYLDWRLPWGIDEHTYRDAKAITMADGDAEWYELAQSYLLARVIRPTGVSTFNLTLGDEVKTYQYRTNSTFEEWVHSEFNTDGWRAAFNEPDTMISADAQYAVYGGTFIQSEMTASQFSDEIVENLNDTHSGYRMGNAYVVNSESEIGAYGFNVHAGNIELPLDSIRFGYGMIVNDNLSAKHPIVIQGIGVSEQAAKEMEIFAIPHKGEAVFTTLPYENNLDSIREYGTSLNVEYKQLEEITNNSLYTQAISSKMGGFEAIYNPLEDENLSSDMSVDICITYDDEIVYWIFLSPFKN